MSGDTRIDFAEPEDLGYLAGEDRHVPRAILERKIARREVLVLWRAGRRAGFLRFGLFWDEIPFVNLLWIEEGSRGRGLGTQLIALWENEMRKLGHGTVMTSTLSSERGQHLYCRLGYRDCGSLLMPGEPLEILLLKELA